jgi:hypothetical protein
MDKLTHRFRDAALPLEVLATPLFDGRGRGVEDIVQIDIAKTTTRKNAGERFRIYQGHTQNRLEVLGTDQRLRQLVLFVEEPERAFELRIPKRRAAPPTDLVVLREEKRAWVVERRTSGRARHFLCGMDEQHLFIALLPDRVTTVDGAHAALRPPELSRLERSAEKPTVRQGEWFFVAIPYAEVAEVEVLARKSLRVRHATGIAEAGGIRRAGRAHVADEVVVLDGVPNRLGLVERRVYVRGSVRHPDHRTVTFPSWRRALANREEIEAPPPGIGWID